MTEIITPEQQIRNVLDSLKKRVAIPRTRQKTEEIRAIVQQLDNMVDRYFRGELDTIFLEDDSLPF